MTTVRIPLGGLVFEPPKFIRTNTSAEYLFSLRNYTSADTTVSWDLGDGFCYNSTNFSLVHTYRFPGTYQGNIEIKNKINNLTQTWKTVVQDILFGASFERASYDVATLTDVAMVLLLKQGTNINLTVDYGDGTMTSHAYGTYINRIEIKRAYFSVGAFWVNVSLVNDVSPQLTVNTTVFVQRVIKGLSVNVTCENDFVDCFQYDSVTVTASTKEGTNVTYALIISDGANQIHSSQSPLAYRYTALSYGTFLVNVTAFNRVSFQTVTKHYVVKELSTLGKLELSCTLVSVLGNTTNCFLRVSKGTGKLDRLSFNGKKTEIDPFTVNVTHT